MTLERDPVAEAIARGERPTLKHLEERSRLVKEAKEKNERERKENFDRENARRAWINAGNPEETFELNWPALQNEQEVERAKRQQAADEAQVYSSARNVF